jgi:hypothetical protein
MAIVPIVHILPLGTVAVLVIGFHLHYGDIIHLTRIKAIHS